MLRARGLTVTVADRTLVDALEADLEPGEFLAVLGRNGAGKTLTLHTLAGLRLPASGAVSLDDRPLDAWRRRALARRLALLPQDTDDVFPATVAETALIGRHPYISPFGIESAADRRLAREALDRVAMTALAGRDVATLSGGERRRLAIAQVLVQSPDVYLLDEPLNHLDPQHQLDVLSLFRALADRGATIVASLHDVNLASRYARRVLALFGDGSWRLGSCADILRPELLSRLYGVSMERVPWRGGDMFVASGDEALRSRAQSCQQ